MGGERDRRGLIVLADGSQAAFAAGAVAELARSGGRWGAVLGAGLGAQVAVLAAVGEAEEAERRWRRQAELGCPMLRPRIRAWRERLRPGDGLLVLPDAATLGGWLDPADLGEALAPEFAGLPERLRRAGVAAAAAVHDLARGGSSWARLDTVDPAQAGELLTASACFPGGWPPIQLGTEDAPAVLWGGVAAVPGGAPDLGGCAAWDVVCGFPVPVVVRPGPGPSLVELVQRRDEARGAETVRGWTSTGLVGRLVAPTAEGWSALAGRDGADLGLEYPLPWEANGEVASLAIDLGCGLARAAMPAGVSRS